MKKLLLRFIQCILVAGVMFLSVSNSAAQSPDADQQIALRLQTLTSGGKLLHWSGQADHSYFIQASDDLKNWTWAPNIEPGISGPMSYEVDGPTAKGFFRLIRTPHTAADLDSADFDGDGFTNLREITPRLRPGGIADHAGLSPNIQTNPIDFDTDHDGLNDKWEEDHRLDPTDNGNRNINNGPNGDPDGDGLNNLQEFIYWTDPMDFGNRSQHPSQDSDGNGLPDWWEILHFGMLGNNPNQTMPGNGGLTLLEIFNNNLGMGVSSSMSDGISDSWKIANGLDTEDPDIANKDADTDGLTNLDEYEANTNPNNQDTDGEGLIDGTDLYPLIPDPSAPGSFYVGVPSSDEQNQSPEPDWEEVDHTVVELRWESSSNNPENYIIERRSDNDIWQHLATVSGSSITHEDSGLVANRNYEYRIRAIKDGGGGQVASQIATTNYRVPLKLRMLAKTASLSQFKGGFTEFTSPSSPPKHYLKRMDNSSFTSSDSSGSSYGSSSSSSSGNASYSSVLTPSLNKWSYTGSDSDSYQRSETSGTATWTSSDSSSSNTTKSTQPRSRQSLAAITQAGLTYSRQGARSSPSDSSTYSSGGTGSYLFKGTYEPTEGSARWAGIDYDMSRGTLNYSGNSSASNYNNAWTGDSTTSSTQATPNGTGQWSGTSTDTSGHVSNISYAPFTGGSWSHLGWSGELRSTTQTQRNYSRASNDDNSSFSCQATHVLSDEYTTEAFIADTINELADYQDEWIEDYWGWGFWNLDDGWYYGNGTNGSGWEAAEWNLSATKDSLSTSKFKYKFTANPSAPTTMRWAEIFVPEDDEDTLEIDESKKIEIIAERTWELTGSENESPEFEIDPTTTPPSRNGHYNILLRPVAVSISGIGEAGKNVGGQDSSPGKVVLINDGDADDDGITDYADGYNRCSSVDADNESPGISFIPIHIGFQAVDPAEAEIKFTFDASDPQGITSHSTTPHQLPSNGRIRIWTKDGSQQRNSDSVSQGGDLIKSGVAYSLEDLGQEGLTWGDLTVFAEVVKTSDSVADTSVKVEIKPNANLEFAFSDQVRFTGVTAKLLQRSPRQEEFTEASGFGISKVTKDPTEPPLEVDEQLLPGGYQEYKLVVSDPRSNLTKAEVRGQTVPLSRSGGQYESAPFICVRHDARKDITGTPQMILNLAGGPTALSYNPILEYNSKNHVKSMSVDRRNLAREIDDVIEELKATNFDPVAYDYQVDDDGAFGKEVHKRVGNKYLRSDGWIVGGYFRELDDGRWKYLGTAKPNVLTGTTEVDIMRLDKGYSMRDGTILNSSKINFLVDIKTTASGKLDFNLPGDQGSRLTRLLGGNTQKLNVIVPFDRWTRAAGWVKNKRFVKFAKILGPLAMAGSVWNSMNAQAFEPEFDEIVASARMIRQSIDSGADYELIVTPALLLYRGQVHSYLAHFVPDENINTVATMRDMYKIMTTQDADWLNLD